MPPLLLYWAVFVESWAPSSRSSTPIFISETHLCLADLYVCVLLTCSRVTTFRTPLERSPLRVSSSPTKYATLILKSREYFVVVLQRPSRVLLTSSRIIWRHFAAICEVSPLCVLPSPNIHVSLALTAGGIVLARLTTRRFCSSFFLGFYFDHSIVRRLCRLDHTKILGDTVELIGFEKAGIFKPGVPALVGDACPVVELLKARL